MKFTNDEDITILHHIAENKVLTHAFKKASVDLNRSVSSIQGRWYRHLKNNVPIQEPKPVRGINKLFSIFRRIAL